MGHEESVKYLKPDEYGVSFFIGGSQNPSLDPFKHGLEIEDDVLNFISERRQHHIEELTDILLGHLINGRDELKRRIEVELTGYESHGILSGYSDAYGPYTQKDRAEASTLHLEAQRALGFTPLIHLYTYGSKARPLDIKTMAETLAHICSKGLPAYLTLMNRLGEEKLVRGFNPLKNIEIHNPEFDSKVVA